MVVRRVSVFHELRWQLTETVKETKSQGADVTFGLLFGWHAQDETICLACCTPDGFHYLPFSMSECIGSFCCAASSVTDENEVFQICEKVLMQNQVEESSQAVLLGVWLDSSNHTKIVCQSHSHWFGGNANYLEINFSESDTVLKDCIIVRAKGTFPLIFEFSETKEALTCSITAVVEKIISTFKTHKASFHLSKSLYLMEELAAVDKRTLSSISHMIEKEYGIVNGQDKMKKHSLIEKRPLSFNITIQATGQESLSDNSIYTPTIHFQRRCYKAVTVPLPVDVIAVLKQEMTLSEVKNTLEDKACDQLLLFKDCLQSFIEKTKIPVPAAYHVWPNTLSFPVTVVYPGNKEDTELVSYREKLHRALLLQLDRPQLRRQNSHRFSALENEISYLRNTHVGLWIPEDGHTQLVRGTYTYHHYMQDHMDDDGWGCAYRSLQTVVSWFRFQGYIDKPVPTHKEIQQALVEVGDKPSSFVGSRKWIGSQEVSICLNQLIGVTSKIMFVSSGAELANKGRELLEHFKIQGTPVMIGGGVLAHTILGINFNEVTGDIKFLILDPHYTGNENLSTIQNKLPNELRCSFAYC
ncbi:UFM1 specific peptidase 2 isoform X2 [Tachypleus tridentatus]|uniref:UFM1 specific peptidase 2 isoform X2 n=1 Tax=Tachypleus tridentatus TaxID=6853 RepID=UPI003FD284BA